MGWKEKVEQRAAARRAAMMATAADRAAILAEVEGGRPQADIARERGVSRQRINQMLKRAREEAA